MDPTQSQTQVICIKTIGSLDNPAYLFTKHLTRDVIDKHLKCLGFSRQKGRHAIAPKSDYIMENEDEQHTINSKDPGEVKTVRWAALQDQE